MSWEKGKSYRNKSTGWGRLLKDKTQRHELLKGKAVDVQFKWKIERQ